MSIRHFALLLGLLLLALPACGGGSAVGTGTEPMNAYEIALVGEYQLADFRILQPGQYPLVPDQVEDWAGTMVLGADGSAMVKMDLCEGDGLDRASCNRTFRWTADAGLLRLHSVDPSLDDVVVAWDRQGMGMLTTTSFLPMNVENCGLLLDGMGDETLTWICSSL